MEAAPGTAPPVAVSIATDVLPRYFAALGPARPAPPKPAPTVTVTLVRWPFTRNLSDPAGLLAQGVVQEFHDKARFVSENYGESALAKRFGVTRYPTIFVGPLWIFSQPLSWRSAGGA